MERTPVSSSNIAAIGYDPDSGVLEVEFTNGAVYSYSGVPLGEYEGAHECRLEGQVFAREHQGTLPVCEVVRGSAHTYADSLSCQIET